MVLPFHVRDADLKEDTMTTQRQILKQANTDGYTSAQVGYARSENPFMNSTAQWYAWNTGYDEYKDIIATGRPKRKQPAAPANLIALVQPVLALIQQHAVAALKNSKWYKSAPDELKIGEPVLQFVAVRDYAVFYSMGMAMGDQMEMEPFAVFRTTLGPHTAEFRIKLGVATTCIFIDEF